MPPLEIRAPARLDEFNFIRHAWLQTQLPHRPTRVWRSDGHVTKTLQMPMGLFIQAHRRYVDALLPHCTIAIAQKAGRNVASSREVIAGFACVRGDQLHYVYVAFPFRRFGVARALLQEYEMRQMTIVNWTPLLEHLPFPKCWTYNEVEKWV